MCCTVVVNPVQPYSTSTHKIYQTIEEGILCKTDCNQSHLIQDRVAQCQKNGRSHFGSHTVLSKLAQAITKGSNMVTISWVIIKCLNIEQKHSRATTIYIMTLCTAKRLQSLTLLDMERREIKA